MADAYWMLPFHPSTPMAKRPRSDYDLQHGPPSTQENLHYMPQDDNRAGFNSLKDTKSLEESYERYLQKAQQPSFGHGEASKFTGSGVAQGVGTRMPDLAGGMHTHPYGVSATAGDSGPRPAVPNMANVRGMGFSGELPMDPMVRQGPPSWEMPLPLDASNTLFVEGIPRDITPREVAHIFRPFLGYKDARIVTKEPKYHSADPVVLCFVDFTDAACAMRAMNALQGYVVDEKDPDSQVLRLQFSKHPGPRYGHAPRPRSGHAPRGRR